MSPQAPRGTTPGQDPRRPRIRPAQSNTWASAHSHNATEPGGADQNPSALGSPRPEAPHQRPEAPAGSQPAGYFIGTDRIPYFRTAEGVLLSQASDGRYYPIATSDPADREYRGPELDSSTYYQYIAARIAEQPRRAAGPGGLSATGTAGVTDRPGTRSSGSAARPSTAGARAADTNPAGSQLRRRRRRVGVATVVGMATLAVGLLLGSTLLGPDTGVRPSPPQTAGAPAGTGTAPVPEPVDASSPATPAAGDELQEISAADTAQAMDDMQDTWVVQLSAKQEGLRTEGRIWSEEDILAEFEQNQAEHSRVMLLWSGDWSTFQFNDYWITVLDEPYDTADDALATCDALGIDRNHCFARKLSTTEGPDAATKLNL